MGNIKSKRDPSTLSDAEIQLLLHKTDLSRDDILEWHKEFIEEHPDGQVNYDEFLRLYKGIINPNVEGEKYAKALFTFFDNEKNDKLSFSDFLVLTPFEVRPKPVVAEEPVKKESEEVEKVTEEVKEEENKENKEGDKKEGEAEEKKEGEPQENKEDEKKEEVQEKKEEDKKEEAQENKEGETKDGEAQENKEGETKDGEAQENKDSDNKEVKEEAKENGDEEAAKTTTTSKPLEIDDVDEKTLELALAILNERDEKIDKEELFKIPYILCETAGENAASIFETDEQFAKKKFFLFENDKLDRDEFLRLIRAAKRFAAQ